LCSLWVLSKGEISKDSSHCLIRILLGASQREKRRVFLCIAWFFCCSIAIMADVKPSHTLYVNNLNEKVKKDGTF
jgi:hypothetical protein